MFRLLVLITAVKLSLAQQISYEECYVGSTQGVDYRGSVAVTKSGFTCLSWTVGLNYNPTIFPDAGLEDEGGNVCRNPGAVDPEPWCFVEEFEDDNGNTITYELCGLEKCPVAVTTAVIGVNSGDEHTISCVVQGIYSQVSDIEWTTDTATDNVYSSEDGIFEAEEARSQMSTLTLTSDQVLALKQAGDEHTFTCTANVPGYDTTLTATQTVGIDTSYSPQFPGNCVVGNANGADYRGETAVAETGRACKPWANNGRNVNPESYPNAGLDKNYCRNADGESKPWCYTEKLFDGDSNSGWDFCIIRQCATVVLRPAVIRSGDEYISCVVEGIFDQVSGIEWTSGTSTENSYSSKDGVYAEGTQTSTLKLTNEQLIALKEAGGDEHSFTCKVKVPDYEAPLTATETITIKDEAIKDEPDDDSHDCEKTFSCTGNAALTVGKICWLLITLSVFISFTFQRV